MYTLADILWTLSVAGIGFFLGQLYETIKPDGTIQLSNRIARLRRQLIVARSVQNGDSVGAPVSLSAPVERPHTHQGA
jgi:hypothetical protein